MAEGVGRAENGRPRDAGFEAKLDEAGIRDPRAREALTEQFKAGNIDASDPGTLRSLAQNIINSRQGSLAPEGLKAPSATFKRTPADTARSRVFDPQKADFSNAGRAIPSQDLETAARFSVPIPQSSAGQPLVNPARYPTDMLPKDGQPDPRAGQPYPNGGEVMTNWEGKPLKGPNDSEARGQVFFNYTDGKYQGVQSTGDKVLLFNRATPAQRQQLQQWIDAKGGPNSLTPQGVSQLTQYARSIGVGDVYDSDQSYVGSKLTRVNGQDTGTAGYGTFTRQNETVQAGVVTGPGTIPGLNVTLAAGQQAVLIKTGKGEVRHVEAQAFRDTYRNPNGTPIELSQLPALTFKPD